LHRRQFSREWPACSEPAEFDGLFSVALEDRLVQLGYQWDHLLNDCQDKKAALELAHGELPKVMDRCQRLNSPFSASGA